MPPVLIHVIDNCLTYFKNIFQLKISAYILDTTHVFLGFMGDFLKDWFMFKVPVIIKELNYCLSQSNFCTYGPLIFTILHED